jgi:hypothetical protein
MALMCGHIDHNTISMRGRWHSDPMLRYLHLQAKSYAPIRSVNVQPWYLFLRSSPPTPSPLANISTPSTSHHLYNSNIQQQYSTTIFNNNIQKQHSTTTSPHSVLTLGSHLRTQQSVALSLRQHAAFGQHCSHTFVWVQNELKRRAFQGGRGKRHY